MGHLHAARAPQAPDPLGWGRDRRQEQFRFLRILSAGRTRQAEVAPPGGPVFLEPKSLVAVAGGAGVPTSTRVVWALCTHLASVQVSSIVGGSNWAEAVGGVMRLPVYIQLM